MINKHHIHKFLSKVALITICLLSFGSNNSWAQCTFSATVQGSAGTTTRYYLTDPLGNVIDDTLPIQALRKATTVCMPSHTTQAPPIFLP